MKINGFKSTDGIKNRAISASFDANEQRMGHYTLHCAACNASMNVSEMTGGFKRNGRIYVLLNHSGRAFSQNARIYKGLYFCGNCGRSRIWNDVGKYKDAQQLISAIQAQATINREYRAAAKVKETTIVKGTAEQKEIIKSNIKARKNGFFIRSLLNRIRGTR